MENKAWLKAGLIAAGVTVALQVIGLIPCISCLIWPITCVAWFVIPAGCGYLTAHWADLKRDQFQEALTQGALAGLLLGVIAGVGTIVTQMISSLLDLGTQTALSALEEQDALTSTFTTLPVGLGGALVCGSVACLIGIVLDVIFSAIGSVIKVAMSKK
ncbi:hypothetical protein ACFLY9_01570 [Patescibacteria group bacterium]